MFCPITSSKLSRQWLEFSLKIKVMRLIPGYLLKFFKLYHLRFFSATSASKGSLIEWRIALLPKNTLGRSTYVLNGKWKNRHDFKNWSFRKVSISKSMLLSLHFAIVWFRTRVGIYWIIISSILQFLNHNSELTKNKCYIK